MLRQAWLREPAVSGEAGVTEAGSVAGQAGLGGGALVRPGGQRPSQDPGAWAPVGAGGLRMPEALTLG